MKEIRTKTLEAQTIEILKAANLFDAMEDLTIQDIDNTEVAIFTLTGGKSDIKELLYFWATSPLIEANPSLEINIEPSLTDEPLILITQSI